MKRNGSLHTRLVTLCGAILLASPALGCSSSDAPTSAGGDTGSLDLQLELANGAEIIRVEWVITRPGMDPMSGDAINTSAPGATVSIEVYGLEEGEGYQIDMTAESTDEETTCRGDAPFSITAGKATAVDVMLNCKRPSTLGSVRANGEFNICAELAKVIVSPLETFVNDEIDLSATGIDVDNNEIEYRWTVTEGGEIADDMSAETTFTCTSVSNPQITISVSDDGFDYCNEAEWTVPVTCVGNGTIVFVSERTGDDELYAMDGDGTEVERLTDTPGPDRAPTWDLAGAQLVFHSQRAPHDDQTELYRLDFLARETTRITDDPLDDQRGAWTPDGSAVVFQRGAFFTGFGLWRHQLDTGTEELLVSWPGTIAAAASVSPDGATLVFQSNHESTGIFPFRLYTLDLATLEVEPLFHAPSGSDDGPRWSPDGTRIAFSSSRGDSSSLYVADLEAGQLEQVTDDGGWDISPSWSPDGNRLVFQSDRVLEDGGLHVVDLRSGELSYLGEGRTPVWSSIDRDDDGV